MDNGPRKSSLLHDPDALIDGLYSELAQFFASGSDISIEHTNALYKTLTRNLIERLSGCAGCVLFLDPDQEGEFDRLFPFAYGGGADFHWWEQIARGKGRVWRALESGKTDVLDDVKNDPSGRYLQLNPSTVAQISIPIRDRSMKLIGAMCIEFERKPDRREIDSVIAVSPRLERFLFQLEERVFHIRGQHVLEQISSVAHARTEREAVKIIMDCIDTIVGGGEVALLTRSAGQLFVTDSRHISKGDIPPQLPVGISEGVGYTSYVAHSRTPFYCRDTRDRERYQYYRTVEESTRSQYTIPLLFRRELVGVLNVGAREAYAFSYTDRELLQSLARHAAHSLYYKRLVTEINTISYKAIQKLSSWSLLKREMHDLIGKTQPELVTDATVAIDQAIDLIGSIGFDFRADEAGRVDIGESLNETGILRELYAQSKEHNFTIKVERSGIRGPAICALPARHLDAIVKSITRAILLETEGSGRETVVVELSAEEIQRGSYFALKFVVQDPNGVLSDFATPRAYQELLSPVGEDRLPSGGLHPGRPNLWLCDRLLASHGGYLDVRLDREKQVAFVAYLRS